MTKTTASKITAGMTVRKTAPYKGYQVCEWTLIGKIERRHGRIALFDSNGEQLDGRFTWSGGAAFEVQ